MVNCFVIDISLKKFLKQSFDNFIFKTLQFFENIKISDLFFQLLDGSALRIKKKFQSKKPLKPIEDILGRLFPSHVRSLFTLTLFSPLCFSLSFSVPCGVCFMCGCLVSFFFFFFFLSYPYLFSCLSSLESGLSAGAVLSCLNLGWASRKEYNIGGESLAVTRCVFVALIGTPVPPVRNRSDFACGRSKFAQIEKKKGGSILSSFQIY